VTTARDSHTFEAFKKKQQGPPPMGTCSRCAKNTTAGSVGLQIRERYGAANKKTDKTLASMSKSLCEPCAVQVYEELIGLFTDLMRRR
jgi:hypothetical protein